MDRVKRAEVVKLLRQGATVRDICGILRCSPKTVVKIRHELGLYGYKFDKNLQIKRLRWRLKQLEDEVLDLRRENYMLKRLLVCSFVVLVFMLMLLLLCIL